MVDFIKLYWRDKTNFEIFASNKNNFPDAYKQIHIHTGEINYPLVAQFYNMNISIAEKSASMRNSIHKLYNCLNYNEEHNYNEFSYSMLIEMIELLTKKIGPVNEAYLTHLEFGLNIPLDIPAEIIIRKNVLMHKFEGHSHNREYYGQGRLKQFDHYNYVVKIYDKAMQFELEDNIIRIEVKFLKSDEFYKLGIFKLTDLKSKRNLRVLFKYLLKRFDELIIVDSIAPTDIIDAKDMHKLNKYVNPMFWEEDLSNRSRTTVKRFRDDFLEILIKYNLLKTKTLLRKLLIKKFIYLMNN